MMNRIFVTMSCIFLLASAQAPDSFNIFIGDFNGDGLDDILRQKNAPFVDDSIITTLLYYSTPDGSFNNVSLPQKYGLKGGYTNIYLGDFDGDGLQDFLRQDKNTFDDDWENTAIIYYSVGESFQPQGVPESFALPGDFINIFIGDFNGDGLDDFLRQEKNKWDDDNVYTAHVFFTTPVKGDYNPILLPEDFQIKGDLTNLFIADFNGDKKDDILRQEKGAWLDNHIHTASILLSTGDGTFSKVSLSLDFQLSGDLTNLYTGDFNGDGFDDILRQKKQANGNLKTVTLLLSTTSLNFNEVALPENLYISGENANLYIGDFNGDFKDDILVQRKGISSDTAILLLSNGDGTFQENDLPQEWNLSGDIGNLYVGDFNGDEKDDFIHDLGGWDQDLFYSNGLNGFYKA